MLSAYPPGQTPPDPFPVLARAVLFSVAAYDADPAPYVGDGLVTQADADFAYNLRPSVAVERAAAGVDEAAIAARVSREVDVHLGLIPG